METFDKRAAKVKTVILANKGKMFDDKEFAGADGLKMSAESLRENMLLDVKAAVKQVDSLRAGTKTKKAIDITWADYVKDKWGFAASDSGSPDSFYSALGVNPSQSTIQSLMSMPDFDESFRWLVPEIFREAIRLGLRKSPIYGDLIAAEETVAMPSVIMPFINMSDATMKKLNEGETIPTGSASFGQKTVKLSKVGIGLKITDEVLQYVAINVLSLYLQDVGVKLNVALDNLAIDALINGDQADGSESCAVVGVNTTSTLAYIDILRAWVRMGRIGRGPAGMLSNEAMAIEALQLAEFKTPVFGEPLKKLAIKTPIPASQNVWIHGAMPSTNQIMLIDTTSALIKLNSAALRVESERIVEKQINGTYVSLTTGFANMFRDARIILDKSVAYSATAGAAGAFPTWMDVSAAETDAFKTTN